MSRESHVFCNMHYILLTICKMCQLLKRTIANREDVLNYVCMPWFWLNHLENEFSNVVQICHCWNHILAFILFVGCVMCKHTHTHSHMDHHRITDSHLLKSNKTTTNVSNWSITWVFLCICKYAYNHDLIPDISVSVPISVSAVKWLSVNFKSICYVGAQLLEYTLCRVHHLFAPYERLNERLNKRSDERLDKTKLVCRSVVDVR